MPPPNFVPVMPSTSRNTQRSGVSPSTSTLWEIPLTSMMKDMAAAVSMRAVSQTRIVEIACRSAIEEEARVREKQIGILVLGPMPRVGIDDQLRVRYVLSERVHELIVGTITSLLPFTTSVG